MRTIGVVWSCWAERAALPEGTKTMALRHSASFLQTFHSAKTAAQRTEESQTAIPTDHMDTDPAALAFVKGRPSTFAQSGRILPPGVSAGVTFIQPTDGSYFCEINGHKVRCGGPFVSEKQAKWIIDIATTRVLPVGATAESVLVRLEQGFAKFSGSQFITTYKDLPRATAEMAEAIAPGASTEEIRTNTVVEKFHSGTPQVPAGRYALRGEDDVVKFYRFDKPTEGKWAGYTFLKAQSSDDLYPIRNQAEKNRILAAIAEDILGAEQLYGQELGKCSRCGRTLTDETSRKRGMGLDCWNK
jgi:uncharacterized protein DUF6011